MASELAHASLTAALRWVESTGATGSMKVEGSQTGSLFFESGRLYFASVEGVAMSGSELADAGIDRTLWQSASQQPDARLNFVDELMGIGCPRAAVERFVRRRLESTIELLTLSAGPVATSKGRHGFGTSVSFLPSEIVAIPGPSDPPLSRVDDDALVSLANVHPQAVVTLDGEAWNALTVLLSPARFVELVEALGGERARHLVTSLDAHDLVTVVRPQDASDHRWAEEKAAPLDDDTPSERSLIDEPPAASTLFAEQAAPEAQDDDEYVPDRVGRQAYAAMASMRASSRSEPPPQEKARALKRLIEAVRGL